MRCTFNIHTQPDKANRRHGVQLAQLTTLMRGTGGLAVFIHGEQNELQRAFTVDNDFITFHHRKFKDTAIEDAEFGKGPIVKEGP